MIKRVLCAMGLAIAVQTVMMSQEAPMPPLRSDQVAFLALYKELVETNTTLSAGSCTLAAEQISTHLKAAGFGDQDVTRFSEPDHPKEGGLVAILPGSSKTAKPMLLLGHLDVVEAKRADGLAIRSRSSRKTGISMGAEPAT
jgi:acetylornithine deacetylase/succinyl-diaminopimelate desuccinylase-like protein